MAYGFRQFMLVVAGGLMAISIRAQSGPEIRPQTFDFGYAPQNATLVCQVWAHATDEDTLSVTEIKTGCGCLVIRPEPAKIVPGDSLRLSCYWQTRGYVGARIVSAYLYLADSGRPAEIAIGGNIVTEDDSTASIHWWPRRLAFGRGSSGRSNADEQVITLTNRTETTLLVTLAARGSELALVLPDSIPAMQTGLVRASLAEPSSGDSFESSFTLEFSGNEKGLFRVSIPVVRGDFSFRPKFTTTKQ